MGGARPRVKFCDAAHKKAAPRPDAAFYSGNRRYRLGWFFARFFHL
jgi:hypothetical protein